jgi:ribulose bisphosphate carboxylase small subunit
LEHDEEITQAIYDRVRASELDGEFKQKMGDTPQYGIEAELSQGYNIRKIYANKPMAEAFPFTSDQIDAAKKAGTLKQVATASLDYSNEYDHKEATRRHQKTQTPLCGRRVTRRLN